MNNIQPNTPIERAAYIMAKLSAGQSVGMIDAFIGAEYAAALDTPTKYALFAMVVQRRIQEGI